MAIESTQGRTSVCVANADLSGSQFLAVRVATADFNVVLESTGGVAIMGILQNKPTAGQAADVCFSGVTKAVAGAAYAKGATLMTNSSGQLIAATSTNQIVAYALEAALGAGEIRSVLLLNGGAHA